VEGIATTYEAAGGGVWGVVEVVGAATPAPTVAAAMEAWKAGDYQGVGFAIGSQVPGAALSVAGGMGMAMEFSAARSAAGRVPRSFCFAAGTPVLMADGSTVPIEQVKEGDWVLSDDPSDGEIAAPRRVVQVHRTATYRLLHIEIDCEPSHDIPATGSHPFWTQRGWVSAEDLVVGDLLTDDSGREVQITRIWDESTDVATFNLSIEGTHTYFVLAGGTAVLVHNVDPHEIMFTQDNYGPVFEDGDWAGRPLSEAIDEARLLGRLPDGLELHAMKIGIGGDERWVTLNNRTLAVARQANLRHVHPTDVGPSGINTYQRLLSESGLTMPVEDAQMRCK
jgi:hypothetical protein